MQKTTKYNKGLVVRATCLLLFFCISLALLAGCGAIEDPLTKQETVHVVLGEEDIDALLQSSEPVLLYVGRPTCSDCTAFTPLLLDFITTHLDSVLYYYNTDNHREDANYAAVKEALALTAVPIVYVIAQGEIVQSFQYTEESADEEAIAALDALYQVYVARQAQDAQRSGAGTLPDGRPICPSCSA